MDPCDLLVEKGAEPFQTALTNAVDALEYKLNQVLAKPESAGVEGRRRLVDTILGIIALAPDLPGQAGAVRRELMITRIAQRMAIKEETIRLRLKELRADRKGDPASAAKPRIDSADVEAGPRKAPAAIEEKELLQLLLVHPDFVARIKTEIPAEEIRHPGLRQLLEGMYRAQTAGETPSLDAIRMRLDNPQLAEYALQMQDVGRMHADKEGWLKSLLDCFRKRRAEPHKVALQNQLQAASDHAQARDLLRRLQEQKDGMAK
jgi:DNA primase